MLLRSSPLFAVKVVSASLIESMLTPDKNTATTNRQGTLTFHLHRLRQSEKFGIDYAFQAFGDCDEACFIRGMPEGIVASSAALQGVFHNRQKSADDMVQVISINGVMTRSKAAVEELLDSSRDVVVQCNVSAAASSASGPMEEGAAVVSGEDAPVEALDARKGRQKNPTISISELDEVENTEEADEEPTGVRKRVRGRRGSSRKTPALRKMPRRSAGANAVEVKESRPDADSSALSDSALHSVEENINKAALEKLRELPHVKTARTRGRRSTGDNAPREEKQQSALTEEMPDDIWLTHAVAALTEEGQPSGASVGGSETPTSKRRGRPRKTPQEPPAVEVEAVERPKRGRPRKTAMTSESKQQQQQPREQDYSDGEREDAHMINGFEGLSLTQSIEDDFSKTASEKKENGIIELEL